MKTTLKRTNDETLKNIKANVKLVKKDILSALVKLRYLACAYSSALERARGLKTKKAKEKAFDISRNLRIELNFLFRDICDGKVIRVTGSWHDVCTTERGYLQDHVVKFYDGHIWQTKKSPEGYDCICIDVDEIERFEIVEDDVELSDYPTPFIRNTLFANIA